MCRYALVSIGSCWPLLVIDCSCWVLLLWVGLRWYVLACGRVLRVCWLLLLCVTFRVPLLFCVLSWLVIGGFVGLLWFLSVLVGDCWLL